MSQIVMLDTGPLGLVTNPRRSPANDAAAAWLQSHLSAGTRIIIPEIANYELRRELLLAGKVRGLNKLDDLIERLEYLPPTTQMIYEAARCWAEARRQGRPTADSKALDGDMLLVAQTRMLRSPDVVIATVDVGDLPFFVPAQRWDAITP